MSDSDRPDVLVFIGRFQPFHAGHLFVVRAALQQAQRLILLCGSAHAPRSVRNPWTVEERARMILGALDPAEQARVHIEPLQDYLYNDQAWVDLVRAAVAHSNAVANDSRIGLIGHTKDSTSYYLELFPEWSYQEVDNFHRISATPIREQYLRSGSASNVLAVGQNTVPPPLPDHVIGQLQAFATTPAFRELSDEFSQIEAFRLPWSASPYTPFFVTVDAMVVQNGHILLVERGGYPGKGLLALPGGFVEANELLFDACMRELVEETCIELTTNFLRSCLNRQQVFDEPSRSERGRMITHAYRFDLPDAADLPAVRGADDAAAAVWTPLADLHPGNMFEDHFYIIRALIEGSR